MAKISCIQRNNKRKVLNRLLETKRANLKLGIYSKNMSLSERFSLILKLAKLPRNSARNRIRNRCELTGRPRGYYRKFGLSRNMIRELAGQGMLPGIIKSSW